LGLGGGEVAGRGRTFENQSAQACIGCGDGGSTAYDLDGDGVPELVSGWESGKVEVRSDRTGEVIYTDKFKAPIADIVSAGMTQTRPNHNGRFTQQSSVIPSFSGLSLSLSLLPCPPDYRMDGKEEIIVLSAEGEVRGYLPVSDEAQRATLDGATEEKLLHELTARKNVCLCGLPVLL
jgi:Bardet-Biedl syndrome 2 protein